MGMFKEDKFVPDERPLPWPELDVPLYHPRQMGRWEITFNNVPMARGYFRGLQWVKRNYVLSRDGETWMSLTPMEIEAQMHHVDCAKGHTMIIGAGLGLTLYNILKKKDVEHVTLIENDPGVINLLIDLKLKRWVGYDKLFIGIEDALDLPRAWSDVGVDFMYVDIWKDLGSYEAIKDVRKIQESIGAKELGWWGQELDFITWCNKNQGKPPPTKSQYQQFVRDIDLPLSEFKGCNYPYWCLQAAENVIMY